MFNQPYVVNIGQNEQGILTKTDSPLILGMVSGGIDHCVVLIAKSRNPFMIVMQHYDQTTDPTSLLDLERNLAIRFDEITLIENEQFIMPGYRNYVEQRLREALHNRIRNILYTWPAVKGVSVSRNGIIDTFQTLIPDSKSERKEIGSGNYSVRGAKCGNPCLENGSEDKNLCSSLKADQNTDITNLNSLFNTPKPIFTVFKNGKINHQIHTFLPLVRDYIETKIVPIVTGSASEHKAKNMIAHVLSQDYTSGIFNHPGSGTNPNLDSDVNRLYFFIYNRPYYQYNETGCGEITRYALSSNVQLSNIESKTLGREMTYQINQFRKQS